eukprot:SAG11_NODE_1560_length_4678_cov_14.225158_3_plen_623_part_00
MIPSVTTHQTTAPRTRDTTDGQRGHGTSSKHPTTMSMNAEATVVALVPMKHTSVRVRGKNYRSFQGQPLCYWVLKALMQCPRITQIVVDTDSELLKGMLAKDFPTVKVIDRPAELLNDPPMNEILLHDTSVAEADFYLQTHSTNPFLKPETINGALDAFLGKYPHFCDSLFSVTQRQTRFYDQLGRAINHNPDMLARTQDLPPVYEENSCLYIFTRETLVARRHRIGNRPFMFPMADFESTDIDTEFEFSVAEAMATKMQFGGSDDVQYMLADKIGAGALPGGAKINVTAIRPVPGAAKPAEPPLVLITAPHIMAHLDRFVPLIEDFGCKVEVADVLERMEASDLLEWAGKFDGTICGDDRYTEEVFEACCPRLKVVSKWGTGIDSIDQVCAKTKGVMIGNTPGAFTLPVSDSVLSYILQFCRQQVWMDQHMKLGRWHKINGRSLKECTVGIVGVGDIGKEVMKKCAPFGCRLLGYDIVQPSDEFVASVNCEMTTLEELLAQSDFVSINCQLTDTTNHLMNEERFAMMRDSAYLINTARGPIVKESALVQALQAGALAGCALDVFEFEPLPVESPLRMMDNVLIAPHNSNSSPTAHENVQWNTLRNLMKGLGIPYEDYEAAI